MDKVNLKQAADDLVTTIKAHIADRVAVIQGKYDGTRSVLADQSTRIAELEARIKMLEDALEAERKAAPILRIA